jgi:hypothetical protein
MTQCANPVQGTNLTCGDEGPDTLRRYCSEECADREGKAELAAMGITPEMMKEAVGGYYECKEMIERREEGLTSGETPSDSPCSSSQ